MKKWILTVIIMLSCILVLPSKVYAEEVKHSKSFNYMDTDISVVATATPSDFLIYEKRIEEILSMYDALSDHFKGLNQPSIYRTNIYEINQKSGQKIEIDQALYELLVLAESIKEETSGYFDIAIGSIINIWKKAIETYKYQEITEDAFQEVMEQIEKTHVPENPVILTQENGTYYIETKIGVLLDLGAIAKGYAVQKVYEYLKGQGVTYFYVNGGMSSIALGKNQGRADGNYWVDIENPMNGSSYAKVKISDLSITTSGNNRQYFTYKGKRYHHIISPITKVPTKDYHSLTMINEDAGRADALTTAFMAMPKEVLKSFLKEHAYEVIAYQENNQVFNHTDQVDVTILKEEKQFNAETFLIIIVASVLVMGTASIGIYYIKNKKKGA